MFNSLFLTALIIFFLGFIYKVSNWFVKKIAAPGQTITTTQRMQSAAGGIFGVIFSSKLLIFLKVILVDVLLQGRVFREDLTRWLSRVRLERMCQLSAERLSMIYGLHSPDFFNKTLFHDFIRTLQDQDVLRRNSDGLLEFDDDVIGIGTDARLVLGEEIRHSILSLTVPEDQVEE